MRITLDAPTGCTADLSEDSRTIAGVVVPYGIPGNTSLGKLEVDAGALTWPEDLSRVKLTREHDRTEPRGYGINVSDGVSALEMTFRAAKTPAGDEALLEAAERIRDGLSVDLDDVVISAGHVTAGRVIAVGQVAVPAYESARVAASETTTEEPPPEKKEEDDSEEEDEVNDDEKTTTVQAAVPPGLPRVQASGPQTMADFYRQLTAIHKSGGSAGEMRAALANITHTANKWVQSTQYEGELWSGVAYQRTVVPLISSASLTSYTVNGWKWQDPPTVATYAGDKTAVPSDTAATVAVTVDAKRLAGAHDLDRKFKDFNDTEFFASYYRAMTESYALESDKAALADLQAVATAFTQTVGSNAWATIMAMSFSLGLKGPATFALIGSAVALSMASITTANNPANLDLVGGLPQIVYSPLMAAGSILVGNRAGATFFELPGSPIRVEAIDMVNGGIDAGVFGYFATNVHAPTAFAKTTFTPPAGDAGTQAAPTKGK